MAEDKSISSRRTKAGVIAEYLMRLDGWIEDKEPQPLPPNLLGAIISPKRLDYNLGLYVKNSSPERWCEILGKTSIAKRQKPMMWIADNGKGNPNISMLLALLHTMGLQENDIRRIVFGSKGEWYITNNIDEYIKSKGDYIIPSADILRKSLRLIVPAEIHKGVCTEFYIKSERIRHHMSDLRILAPTLRVYRDEAIKAKMHSTKPQPPNNLTQSIIDVVDIVTDSIDYNNPETLNLIKQVLWKE